MCSLRTSSSQQIAIAWGSLWSCGSFKRLITCLNQTWATWLYQCIRFYLKPRDHKTPVEMDGNGWFELAVSWFFQHSCILCIHTNQFYVYIYIYVFIFFPGKKKNNALGPKICWRHVPVPESTPWWMKTKKPTRKWRPPNIVL